jgi:hypothetical protein
MRCMEAKVTAEFGAWNANVVRAFGTADAKVASLEGDPGGVSQR